MNAREHHKLTPLLDRAKDAMDALEQANENRTIRREAVIEALEEARDYATNKLDWLENTDDLLIYGDA